MMRSVKIVPINDLEEMHDAFNFFKASFFQTVQTENIAFLPLSEIYQAMVDNMEAKRRLQFMALMDGKVAGCIICQPIDDDKGALFMPVLAVNHDLRGAGIASKLLHHLEQRAAKQGYFRLKVKNTATSLNFFRKNDFEPFVYLKVSSPYTLTDVKEAVSKEWILVEEHVGTMVEVKFMLPSSFTEREIRALKKKLKNFDYEILFEKRF